MSKATFRNDSGVTVYLEEYGHQQMVNTEVVTIFDDNQATKFADSTQLNTLIAAGDLVYIDDLGADRTIADATKILEGMRDKVVAGGTDGEYLCTSPTGVLVWGAGAVIVKEEGSQVGAGNCTSINFVGPAITATDAGSGQVDVTVVALMNILEDTTPQLGGMLDVNGFAIGNGSEELIKFVETGSAVNEITITNAATGNSPSLSATGDDTDIDLLLSGKGTGLIVASSGYDMSSGPASTLATKQYVDDTVSASPTGLTGFHEVWHFYEQGATGDLYMMRADSLVSSKNPGHVALANGRVVHVTSAREKSPEKYCDIVIRKQTATGTAWASGTWANVGTALLMNNTILSDTYTDLANYTFNAGDAVAIYLDKTTPSGGTPCESPFVALYVKYD